MELLGSFKVPFEQMSNNGQVVDITPREAVRRVGDKLDVLCKVGYSIDSCRMTVGNTPYRLIPSQQDGEVVYFGQGLQFGECGATIKNIREDWNGNITCVLPPQTGNIEVQASMRLVVARSPVAPQLRSSPQPAFREGDEFRAQCVVADGRPAARITWFLDEDQILRGIHQPIVTTEGDLQTISQNITLPLTADEAGKTLACRAEHEALDQPKEAKRQLIVHYPPKRQESGMITIFGLKLGAEGRLNVTVRASPEPVPEWRYGDATIMPSHEVNPTMVTALEPVALGGGFYNLTLFLPHITKEDVDRKYYLRASNDLGAEEFTVLISTMDEPAGVELEAGAIVGIVIAVLAAVAAISLLVFAKATDRWCFAGSRGRDHAKASGESDTESAVGGGSRSRLAALSARVRAALPRAKDKVQATEARAPDTEDKPLSEEKKNVVYAELQLGEQTAEKPPPPSTEYAEIVYTDQPKETKE
ncbi:unnamed protein product [Chilo suppressalis]|uniref:Ig-like domain-containing protein n=1 Tax=Chilo suppressalis TaxID=168631 RepID=A0ABN8B957_CHISP|nr:hypothetical protein evm_012408 [Chilo suppressalis]CAH0404521.1 unnamed protein product [Chilo suppressalis]